MGYDTQITVKTEKEFSEFFVESCAAPNQQDFVRNLSAHYWSDLTTHLNRYFSNEDRLLITKQAAKELSDQLQIEKPEEAWKKVIRSFAGNCWGFVSQDRKPQSKKTEEQLIFWKFFKYAWAMFQATILVKIAILYFGLSSAENPEQISSIWIVLACAVSLGSLGFFAYRNRNDKG